jgi:hypothetical protein
MLNEMRLKPTVRAAALLAVAAGCGSDPEPAATTSVALPPAETTTVTAPPDEPAPPPEPAEPPGPAETATEDPRINALERRAAGTVRAYVGALDARDGAAVCELLADGVLDGFALPEPRGSCAASLSASIGYRDPRGLPVWEGARVGEVRVIELDAGGGAAKVVATVLTTFADREEVSVEDDVVYLTRTGGRWLIAKPSATLYRAVGVADIPPSVLSPPA